MIDKLLSLPLVPADAGQIVLSGVADGLEGFLLAKFCTKCRKINSMNQYEALIERFVSEASRENRPRICAAAEQVPSHALNNRISREECREWMFAQGVMALRTDDTTNRSELKILA